MSNKRDRTSDDQKSHGRIRLPVVPPQLCWAVIEGELERGVVISVEVSELLGDASEPDVDVLLFDTNEVRHRVNAVCNVFASLSDAVNAL